MSRIVIPRVTQGQVIRPALLDAAVKQITETLESGIDISNIDPASTFSVGTSIDTLIIENAWAEPAANVYLTTFKPVGSLGPFELLVYGACDLVAIMVAGVGLNGTAAPAGIWDNMVQVKKNGANSQLLGPVPPVDANRIGLTLPTPGANQSAASAAGVLYLTPAVALASGDRLGADLQQGFGFGAQSWDLSLTWVLRALHR